MSRNSNRAQNAVVALCLHRGKFVLLVAALAATAIAEEEEEQATLTVMRAKAVAVLIFHVINVIPMPTKRFVNACTTWKTLTTTAKQNCCCAAKTGLTILKMHLKT